MQIAISYENDLIIRDDSHEVVFQSSQDDFVKDNNGLEWPLLPAGFASVVFDTDSNLVVAYDDKQNAFPNTEWISGVSLSSAINTLVDAQTARLNTDAKVAAKAQYENTYTIPTEKT